MSFHVGWLRNLVNVIVVPFELVLMSFKGMGESLVIKGDERGGVAFGGELGVIDVVVTVEGVHGG